LLAAFRQFDDAVSKAVGQSPFMKNGLEPFEELFKGFNYKEVLDKLE